MKETDENCYYLVASRRHMISLDVLCCYLLELCVSVSFGDHDSTSVCPASARLPLTHSLHRFPCECHARRSPYLHIAACFCVNIDCAVVRSQLRAATTVSAGCLCLLFNNQNESKRNERQNGMRKTKRKLVIIRYFAESVVIVCCWCHPRLCLVVKYTYQ